MSDELLNWDRVRQFAATSKTYAEIHVLRADGMHFQIVKS